MQSPGKHLQRHKGEEKRITCKICGKCVLKESIVRHMQLHSRDKSYVCDLCKRVFARTDTLQRHLRMHRGEQPHICAYCNLAFSESGNLGRHLKRVHSVIKHRVFDVVKQEFAKNNNFQTHLKTQRGEKPHTVSIAIETSLNPVTLQSTFERTTEAKYPQYHQKSMDSNIELMTRPEEETWIPIPTQELLKFIRTK